MKKRKLTLDLNKRKISNLNAGGVYGGATQDDCPTVGCTLACKPTKARCTTTPISEAQTCTLESVDLSYCGAGTLPNTCQSNQVCA
jgi:hypothetical protein